MASDNQGKQSKWQPPQRPEWVERINEEGECMDIRGVVPLDEESLLSSAMNSTGLSDFGADDWREPFRILIKSFEEDAALNLMGRLRVRGEILQILQARLQIEDTYKRHPEIDDEEIVQPIFIAGQGRSGTSFLVNVLASNPDNGALMQWEAMFPCPPPEKATYETDPRIEKSEKLITQWNRVVPTLASMHEFSSIVPQEDCEIFAINFMSSPWFGIYGQVSTYDAYMGQLDSTDMLCYHKRVLKLLQWKNPRKHWVLKDVPHISRLGPLLKAYPDACFIWPHRDPVRALASAISIIGSLWWSGTDEPFRGAAMDYLVDPQLSADLLNNVIDTLEEGVVPPKQIHHMLYKKLVTDTMGELEAMYQHFGIELSAAGRKGMETYLHENPRDSRPPHKINVAPEVIAPAREAYKRYQAYFNVPSE